METRVDSHHHFWSLADPWFAWPTPDLAPIYKDAGPETLKPLLQAAGITQTVLIQVAPSIAETSRLLDIAKRTDFVAGVVGWVDLEADSSIADLERFAIYERFIGVRPMIQSIPDMDWMLRPSLAPALAALQRLGLTFDALVRPQHLSALCSFSDRYPDLRIVVDHGAKPSIAKGRAGFSAWAGAIATLARRPQVRCKLSGLLTEAGDRTDAEAVGPFIDHLLDVFGPARLLWGSDWPVVELAATYGDWFSLSRAHLAQLSNHEQRLIFGEVAREFYRLPSPIGRTES